MSTQINFAKCIKAPMGNKHLPNPVKVGNSYIVLSEEGKGSNKSITIKTGTVKQSFYKENFRILNGKS